MKFCMHSCSRGILALCISIFCVANLSSSGFAQIYTYYWKDNNNNGQWDWSNNQWWYGEGGYLVGGVNNGGGAVIYFESTGQTATTINNAAAFSGGWFKLNSIYAAANSSGKNYSVSVVSGQSGIELYGKIETISGGGTLSFANIDVNLGGNAEINAVGNTVTLGGLRMNGKTLNSYGANSLNIQGVVQGTGTYNIKNQGITVTYSGSGANTFSGTTTVENSSTLVLNKNANVNAIAGSLTINSGATVRTDAAGQLNNQLVTVNGTLNLNNQNQSLALAGTSGTASVSLGSATMTINNSGGDSFAGVISGTGGLTKTGTGTQTLSGVNTYTGKTAINQGTLSISADSGLGTAPGSAVTDQLQFGGGTLAVSSGFTLNSSRGITFNTGGGTIDVASGQTLTYGGVMAGANAFTKANSGILTLTGNSGSTFSGTTTLTAGTVRLGHNSALGSGSLNLDGGTVASDSNTSRSFNNNVVIRGDVAFGESTTGTGSLTFAGTVGLNSGTRTLTMNQATTFSGAVSNGSLTKAGSAQLTLSSDSSSLSTLTVNAGTVAINGNTTVTGLAGSGTVSIASGKALTTSLSADSTFSGVLSSAGGLTKTGTATLNLTGTSSSYTGTTAINAGMVTISGDGSLGGTSAAISLGGGYLGFNGTFTLNSGRATTIAGASSGFDVYGSQTATYNGAIGETGGSRAFDKKGIGTLVLGGNNSYTGATTISAGVVRATSNTAFGTAAGGVTVTAGAAVQLSGGVTIGAEALTLNGAGVSNDGTLRNISGNNTWQGTISNNNTGRINSDADSLTISGNISNVSGQTLYVGGAGNSTVSGQITGTKTTGDGALFKDGIGTLTLSGDNSATLTGNIVLRSGTVSVANANSLGSGGSIIIGTSASATSTILNVSETTTRTGSLTVENTSTGGVVEVASTKTFTISGVLDQNGGTSVDTRFEKRGAGTLKLSGGTAGTYNGQIRISDGTLVAGSSGSLGDNTSTATRALDLGINLSEQASANNVRLDLANGVNLNQSMYVGGNQGGATRTLGIEGGTGSATFQNEIFLGGNLTFDPGATGTLTVSGKITQNPSEASRSVIKTGAGTTVLSGANDFKGGVSLEQGVLRLNSTTAAGSGTITQSSGASTLEVNTTGTVANQMSIYNVKTLQSVTLSGNKTLNNATYDVASGTTTTESGTLSGTGGITKNGAGTLVVSGSSPNTFTGASAVNAGTLQLQKSTTNAISGSSIAVNSGGTLLLGAANQIGNTTDITMSGGNLDTAGYSDQVGQLKFSGSNVSSTIFGLSSSSNDFLFSGIDTASIGSLGDGGLTFRPSAGNVYSTANGLSIKLSNADWVAAAGGSTTLNGFNSKISFADGTLASQISFSGGESGTYLNVAAIPEPKVYITAGVLAVLIGFAEFRRRKRAQRAI